MAPGRIILAGLVASLLVAGCARIPTREQLETKHIKGREVAEQKDQYYLLDLCESYGNLKRYQELETCLQTATASLEKYGEKPPEKDWSIARWTWHQVPNPKYPVAPRLLLLKAEKELDFGNYPGALEIAARAEGSYQALTGYENMKWYPKDIDYILQRSMFLAELAGIGVVAAHKAGKLQEAAARSAVFEKRLVAFEQDNSGWFTERKEARAARLAIKTRVLLATGRGKEAYELLAEDSYYGPRILEFSRAGMNTAIGIVLAAIPGAQNAGMNLFSTSLSGFLQMVGALKTPYTLPSQFQMAHLRVEAGRLDEARPMLDEMLASESLPSMVGLYWATLFDRGRVAEGDGKPDDAIAYYQQAVDQIENIRKHINTEASRIGFIGDKQDVYRALTRLLFERGRFEEAFVATERAKARVLVDMLADKSDTEFRVSAADHDRVAALIAGQRKADVIVQSNGGAAELLPTAESIQAAGSNEDRARLVRSSFSSVRIQVVALGETARTIDPEMVSLIRVSDISAGAIQKALPLDTTLISYFSDGSSLYAFMVTPARITAVKLHREGLEQDIDRLVIAVHDAKGNYQAPARALHARLIAPVQAQITTTRLIIAAHGAMHYLPFAALHDGKEFLADRYRLSFVPSASILRFQRPGVAKPGDVFALGNPERNLINSEFEARHIAALFPRSVVYVKREATRSRLVADGSGFRYLHLAAHGHFDAANPLNSGIQLAPDKDGDTGLLTAGQVYGLRLDADLVTLSACESGRLGLATGDEVMGLIRGFMYAGARSVVASLWKVDDAATAQLMELMYAGIGKGMAKDEALQLAQSKLRQSESERFKHPYYWAAFQLSGNSQ